MSSSSDSEDEIIAKLRESIDVGFINDDMFKDEHDKTKISKKEIPELKSERYLDLNEGNENSMYVTKSMQSHIAKKLSKLIDNQIKFVDLPFKSLQRKRKIKGGIKLLKGFDEYIRVDSDPVPVEKQKKVEIKRRTIDEVDDIDEDQRIKDAAVDGEFILSKNEVKYWKERETAKVFNYKEKNNIFYLIEPETEFTKLRKKNNWDESKISRNYKKNKNKNLN